MPHPRLVTAAAALVALLAIVAVSSATSPGVNGPVAFRRYLDANHARGAVVVAAPDGSGERQLTTPPKDTVDDQPDFSADGRRIVFDRCPADDACGVWVVNVDGSGLHRVHRVCDPTRSRRCEDDANASFTPDGRIIFTRATGHVKNKKGFEDQIQRSELMTMDTSGHHRHTLLRLTGYRGDLEWGQISPDGSKLFYVRRNSFRTSPHDLRAIFVARADGTGSRRITPWSMNAGDNPDWSPDSTRILFRAPESQNDNSAIYTVRPDGSDLRQLTQASKTTTYFSSAFSPDGTRIVFARGTTDTVPDVFTMAADGSDVQPVTRTADVWESAPDWGAAP